MGQMRPRLSPVPEEEGKWEDEVNEEGTKEEAIFEAESEPINLNLNDNDNDSDVDMDMDMGVDESNILDIDVHGIKPKFHLNADDPNIIPSRYLEKADRSYFLKLTPWIFRKAQDGREVDISNWSICDTRFRGMFHALKQVPSFTNGIYDSHSRHTMESGSSKVTPDEAVKQDQALYAFMEDIRNMLDLRREMKSHREHFFLRPRFSASCLPQPEYWTGYRRIHQDSPIATGSLVLDFHPKLDYTGTVVPLVSTAERKTLKEALEGEFKLLLAQLLTNIFPLVPPGDRLPDQEAFVISLRGSKLHLLRGIFPGQNTSKLWSGRYNPADKGSKSTRNPIVNLSSRFYSKMNLDRVIEQFEWDTLSNPEKEACPHVFQILASREYDLWIKREFSDALKMVAGLHMYLMSGQARCGVLQHVFAVFPYDEGNDPENDDGKEKAEKEQREVEEAEALLGELEKIKCEEEKRRAKERETMRTSIRDRIGGIAEALRSSKWDWDWEDKPIDGRAKDKDDDDEMILGGP